LKNYRAFKDTGDVRLKKLNVFIGANNAGKSSFLATIELLLRGTASGGRSPLPVEEMPSMASFDSVLRKHWGPGEARPTQFQLSYRMGEGDAPEAAIAATFTSRSNDNVPVVSQLDYELNKKKVTLKRSARDEYSVHSGRTKLAEQNFFFSGLTPYFAKIRPGSPAWKTLAPVFYSGHAFRDSVEFEVVNPNRPVPRSVYVIDDPNLGVDDRDLLSYLIDVFSSDQRKDVDIKSRINSSLNKLGLATSFDVALVSKRTASKVVSIRVAPKNKRQKVTIADVGFGISQVLPLIVKAARITKGCLVAYQPEVHLHPFAQSRLADLFVESVGRGNQVFVETHSPDLVLRLQSLIAENKISGADVAVYCFENAGGTSKIEQMEFTDSGMPKNKWPEGFLDTSFVLARELATSRSVAAKGS
jgi:predicted ATPase